ncbi:MAG: diguanylate cyclase (GGDEF)-like protein [Porticoccus sp.]|jgi:diguanylate cyclase (GGDEF)-like protein
MEPREIKSTVKLRPTTSLQWLYKISPVPLDAGAEEEARRQDVMVAILMLTGSIALTGLSVWDLLAGTGELWSNLVTFVVGVLASIIYVLLLKSRKTNLLLTLLMMVFLHFFWLVTGDFQWAGMLWCLVMLPLFFQLLGCKTGAKLVGGITLVSAVVLLWPESPLLVTNYSLEMSYRFLLAYLVLSWISFIVEYVRIQTRRRLEERQAFLGAETQTDELTGLANRRGFKKYLGESEQRCEKDKGSFAVIVGDLDNFKQINDEYGHEVGDFVLQEIGDILKLLVRSEDLVVRWGGDEFLILLVDTDLQGANVLAERAREKIASTSLAVDGGLVAVTMSLGVDIQRPEGDFHSKLGSADKAMYEAKRRGRNCVVTTYGDGRFSDSSLNVLKYS